MFYAAPNDAEKKSIYIRADCCSSLPKKESQKKEKLPIQTRQTGTDLDMCIVQ